MDHTLLNVRELSIAYKGRQDSSNVALSGIDFSLAQGKTLGVVGASGAGKSTLALAIAGLLDMDAVAHQGSILFSGCDLLDLPEKELSRYRGKHIAMIFQDPVASLDPAQRVVDQVAEVFRLHDRVGRKAARERAMQELEAVGINRELLDSAPYAHQLSGGQCQRVMIAAALAGKPALLIADEPTSSLDVILQARIIELIRAKQQQSGMSMIFISHDLPLVSTVADEIMVLSKGEAIELGNCNRILSNPQQEFTAQMINAGRVSVPWGGPDAATA